MAFEAWFAAQVAAGEGDQGAGADAEGRLVVEPGRSHPCDDCSVNTWPWELFMVTDEVWAQAGSADFLCVGCFEERVDRNLEPDDFPAVPLNDDHECDSVRLRQAKGSGRRVGQLYGLAVDAVLDLGVDAATAAKALGLDAPLLEVCVDQAQFGRAALAEIGAAA